VIQIAGAEVVFADGGKVIGRVRWENIFHLKKKCVWRQVQGKIHQIATVFWSLTFAV
jgi:hypothetical protein